MRTMIAAAFLSGAMSMAPPSPVPETRGWLDLSGPGAARLTATHATRGIVKTIDATTLVITRFAHRGEMTFALVPSTERSGMVAVGSTVSVRYREDGRTHIATAVTVRQPRD